MTDDRFGRDVHAFAQELGALLNACVRWAGQGSVKITSVNGDGRTRAVVEIITDTGSRNVPVLANGEPSAALVVRIGCRPDSSGQYMAVTESALAVYSTLDRTPLFRLEYRDDMRTAPSSHWQVHAERGALSNLLTLAGHRRPHDLSALHIPNGGARLRPGVEDFVQFLIDELGIDAVEGWKDAIEASRETWRRRQIKTAVRDVPDAAVAVLTDLGFTVTPPNGGVPEPRMETLVHW